MSDWPAIDLAEALAEARRLLPPGWRLSLTTWGPGNAWHAAVCDTANHAQAWHTAPTPTEALEGLNRKLVEGMG